MRLLACLRCTCAVSPRSYHTWVVSVLPSIGRGRSTPTFCCLRSTLAEVVQRDQTDRVGLEAVFDVGHLGHESVIVALGHGRDIYLVGRRWWYKYNIEYD